ncbi:MAG: RecX family transcriptional regulator [Synergistaceae bacterium]|nr:RecX family transcriptional regulator [Synergistaceae bacterium]
MTFEELREGLFSTLLRRPSTRRQALGFLERAHAPAEAVDALMAEAESMGLVDDEAFARLFADGHLQWGNLKIAHELSARGVSRADIDDALDEVEDEGERARELAESWRASGVEERKITSRLMSRGFTSRAVRSAVEQRNSE